MQTCRTLILINSLQYFNHYSLILSYLSKWINNWQIFNFRLLNQYSMLHYIPNSTNSCKKVWRILFTCKIRNKSPVHIEDTYHYQQPYATKTECGGRKKKRIAKPVKLTPTSNIRKSQRTFTCVENDIPRFTLTAYKFDIHESNAFLYAPNQNYIAPWSSTPSSSIAKVWPTTPNLATISQKDT